jgi:frataxin-like iron-binding protein CyaY
MFCTIEHSFSQLLKEGNSKVFYLQSLFAGEINMVVRNVGTFEISNISTSQTIKVHSPISGLHCFEYKELSWKDTIIGYSLMGLLRRDLSTIDDIQGYLFY